MTLLPKLFLPILLTLSLSACGLFSGSKEETPPADVAATDGESPDDFGFGDGDDFSFEGDDSFAFEEEPAVDGAAPGGEATSDDLFGDSDFFADDGGFPESPLDTTADPFSADAAADPFATDTTTDPFGAPEDTADLFGSTDTFADGSSSTDMFGTGSSFDSDLEESEAKTFVPVKKMADAAFDRGGAKLNRIYIVRDGDDLSSISQKIFGTDRSADLETWNPYFASRAPKVGDKVYYPSPSNPDDNTMMTFYDDKGVPAQTYVASAGDNIRAVSKDLLGHDRSWMEVWATNPAVESKGELFEGATLRYWPSDVSVPTQAASPPAPTMPDDDPFGAPPPANDFADTSMPSDDPFGSVEPPSSGLSGLNPPPSFGDDDPFADSGSAMAPPPPPPPPRQIQPGEELSLPPPPPPPPRAAQKPATAGGEQDNLVLILGGAGLLVLVLVVMIIRRKKSSIDMGHTQV